MHTRPTHRPPQTSKQAKAEYKKHGPRISSQEVRVLKRGAVLLERAERINENEKKRKAAAKKKQEKEAREREARQHMGIPSQKPYVSPHQELMFNWVHVGQKNAARIEDVEAKQRGEENSTGVKEFPGSDPWDVEELDDGALLDTIEPLLAFSSGSDVESSGPEARGYRGSQQERPPLPCEPKKAPDPLVLEGLDPCDFVVSDTQVEREISVSPRFPPRRGSVDPVVPPDDPSIPPLSTQDVSFSKDDLEELGMVKAPAPVPKPVQRCIAKYPAKLGRVLGSGEAVEDARPALEPQPARELPPSKSSTERARDRILMPPPRPPPDRVPSHTGKVNPAQGLKLTPASVPKAAPGSVAKAKPGPIPQATPVPVPRVAPLHIPRPCPSDAVLGLQSTDFDLSSQDCREIYA